MSDLPAGWRRTTLGEVVDVLDHRRVPVSAKERADRTGDVPYYGATGQVGTIDKHLFDEPLLLLGEDGVQFFDRAKSKAYLVDGPAWVNNHAHVLKPRSSIVERKFLLHYLNWVDYRGLANGTTRLKLTQAAMRGMPVLLPNTKIQQRIVGVLEDHLSRLDAAGRSLEQQQLRLMRLRSAQLASLSSGPAKTQNLAELAVKSGYGTSVKCIVGGGGPPVVRIPNIRGGKIDLSDEKRAVSVDAVPASLRLAPGDLLIVRTNGSRSLIGRSAVVDHDTDASFASYLIRYQLDKSKIRPQWAHLTMESPIIRRELEARAASSAGQYNLSLAKLDTLKLDLPSVEEQDQLIRRADDLADSTNRLKYQLVSSRIQGAALRRALLSAAFSGRLTGRSTDAEVVEEIADSQATS